MRSACVGQGQPAIGGDLIAASTPCVGLVGDPGSVCTSRRRILRAGARRSGSASWPASRSTTPRPLPRLRRVN